MLKNLIVVLILLMSGSVFAETPYPAQAPDFIYSECVDVSDRAIFRAMRNLCDDVATEKGYNIGIFRPDIKDEYGGVAECDIDVPTVKSFICLGSPHQEVCLPPC